MFNIVKFHLISLHCLPIKSRRTCVTGMLTHRMVTCNSQRNLSKELQIKDSSDNLTSVKDSSKVYEVFSDNFMQVSHIHAITNTRLFLLNYWLVLLCLPHLLNHLLLCLLSLSSECFSEKSGKSCDFFSISFEASRGSFHRTSQVSSDVVLTLILSHYLTRNTKITISMIGEPYKTMQKHLASSPAFPPGKYSQLWCKLQATTASFPVVLGADDQVHERCWCQAGSRQHAVTGTRITRSIIRCQRIVGVELVTERQRDRE